MQKTNQIENSLSGIAYLVNELGYLAHALPLAYQLGGKFYTNTPKVAQWLKANTQFAVWLNDGGNEWPLYKQMRDEDYRNVILVTRPHDMPPSWLNTIQVFHGVSEKNDLTPWPPQNYTHVLVQGRHYWQPYTNTYPNDLNKMHQVSFTRGCYYSASESMLDRSKPYLVMFSHSDSGGDNLIANYQDCIHLPHPTIIKPHSITYRDERIMDKIRIAISQNPQSTLIEQEDPRYINYHELINNSSLLITDHSSVAFEYTLTKKPIVCLRNGPFSRTYLTNYEMFYNYLHHVHHRKIQETINIALDAFPCSYPDIYFTETNIVDKIREVLKGYVK